MDVSSAAEDFEDDDSRGSGVLGVAVVLYSLFLFPLSVVELPSPPPLDDDDVEKQH